MFETKKLNNVYINDSNGKSYNVLKLIIVLTQD